GEIEAAVSRAQRQAEPLRVRDAIEDLGRQSRRLGAEDKGIARLKADFERASRGAGRQREETPVAKRRQALRPVRMHAHLCQVVVIEAGTPELLVLERVAERLHEMQPAAGVRRQADDVTRVGRDLGMDEDDLEHARYRGAGVRATTRLTTREAPARLSAPASASSVAPVVMTSSTIATRSPCRRVEQAKAPRTFLSRASSGRSVCGGVSRTRTQSAARSGARTSMPTARPISAAWL